MCSNQFKVRQLKDGSSVGMHVLEENNARQCAGKTEQSINQL